MKKELGLNFKRIISIILIVELVLSIFTVFFVPKKAEALSSSYTQYVKSGISAFPESYKTYLNELHELHPNWIFKAYYTGIPWSELTSSQAENKCKKNTIYFKSGTTLLDPLALCVCGGEGDPNYYCASGAMVNFYLDPRNFLSEGQVFQFLDLGYDTNITKDIVQTAVKNSFLSGKYKENGKEIAYVDTIMEAAKESKVSALHISATIIQEVGNGTKKSDGTYTLPSAVSGNYDGYKGYYNFFNYGATDSSNGEGGAVKRGLKKAKELGWDTPTKAIKGGVEKVLANSYIGAGQKTKYFYKFDVVGNEILTEDMGSKKYSSSQFFSHQYMTNLQDPYSQAGTLFNNYNDSGLSDKALSFVIPVYDNMPSAPVKCPTSLKASDGTLYEIDVNTTVNVRNSASSSGKSLGTLRRGMIVASTGKTGDWYQIKFKKASTYDSKNKKWNSTTITGYVQKDYIENIKASSEKVDLNTNENVLDSIPDAKVSDIKSKYKDAKITKADGSSVKDTDKLATGYKVTIEGKTYDIVVYGDINGDGRVLANDYVFIENHIMGSKKINGKAYIDAADINADGKILANDYVFIENFIMGTGKITLK